MSFNLTTPTTAIQFLDVERNAAEVVRTAREPSSPSPREEDALGNFVRGVLLGLASYLLQMVCLTDLSRKAWVTGRHAISDGYAASAHKVFQNRLLARSINAHREDSEGYYLQPRLHTAMTTHPDPNYLNFFHSYGICRGMCYWFAALYLKTKGQFTNPEEHVRAVGKQFEKGASPQAAFLHSIDLPHAYDFLKLRVQEDNTVIPFQGNSHDQICRKLLVRVPGVYGVYVSNHMLLYIKVDDERQYLFDPIVGSIKIDSFETLKTALQPVLDKHNPAEEIVVDRFRD